ncbi:hypothetical protein DEU56DRAFT_27939 [Suillus clintonianus]|uniref:uncharacterized protein n=1 Tax=Suillus clintonianus TaxID=1904413 RepID=UPI001B85EDE2|nr:uncharacterized protein DEU56DRAFT_27939 [Suillus clintonianus]KAG2150429.1 hypothetical protein DEU56DRAFT_27939 [Suillus clintonianus]
MDELRPRGPPARPARTAWISTSVLLKRWFSTYTTNEDYSHCARTPSLLRRICARSRWFSDGLAFTRITTLAIFCPSVCHYSSMTQAEGAEVHTRGLLAARVGQNMILLSDLPGAVMHPRPGPAMQTEYQCSSRTAGFFGRHIAPKAVFDHKKRDFTDRT